MINVSFQVNLINVCQVAKNFKETGGDRTGFIFSLDFEELRRVVTACKKQKKAWKGTRCAAREAILSFVKENCVCLTIDVIKNHFFKMLMLNPNGKNTFTLKYLNINKSCSLWL